MSESTNTPTNRAVKPDQVKTRAAKPEFQTVRARRNQRVFFREGETFAVAPQRVADLGDAIVPVS